mgnify:FL=1
MGLRCEVCSDWLPIFQLSKLCDTCYKIRTIVRAYDNTTILKSLEKNFLIKSEEPVKLADDQKDYYCKKSVTRAEAKK